MKVSEWNLIAKIQAIYMIDYLWLQIVRMWIFLIVCCDVECSTPLSTYPIHTHTHSTHIYLYKTIFLFVLDRGQKSIEQIFK